jgi:hypothetical protein
VKDGNVLGAWQLKIKCPSIDKPTSRRKPKHTTTATTTTTTYN